VSLVDQFDAILAEQPEDWAIIELRVIVDDPGKLVPARVALARANGRPQAPHMDHDFQVTVAHRWGNGTYPGVVRSTFKLLDDLGVSGRVWSAATYDLLQPAPPHRYGP
jgi:hypothetical protein